MNKLLGRLATAAFLAAVLFGSAADAAESAAGPAPAASAASAPSLAPSEEGVAVKAASSEAGLTTAIGGWLGRKARAMATAADAFVGAVKEGYAGRPALPVPKEAGQPASQEPEVATGLASSRSQSREASAPPATDKGFSPFGVLSGLGARLVASQVVKQTPAPIEERKFPLTAAAPKAEADAGTDR